MRPGLLSRLTLAIAVALTSSVPLTQVVLAHIGGEPFIHVPVDGVTPGEPFHIVAADLGADATVTIEIATDEMVIPLGTVTAGPDGHFEADLVLPRSVPDGYRQISARSDDGSIATVWVRVGDGAAPSPGPSPIGASIDPSLLLLLGIVAIAAVVWLIRSRRSATRGIRAG